ncbi:hypothetical protein ABBQ32_004708 [Trebouxia sp. C0010 RCD-2024]
MMAKAGLPQLGQGCSRSTLPESVGDKATPHAVAHLRHPRTYIRLAKSKTPCSAQAVRSQATAVAATDKDFQAWWRNADVKAALSPADFEGLRGMSADREINSGDAIVSLPRTAALVVTPKMKNPFPDEINDAYWSQSQWFEKMAVMLLHERRRGVQSAVSGYVEQLPADFDTLLHWSDQEMQLLMYPHLLQQVQQQKESWHQYYKSVQAATSGQSMTEAELTWALECVRSRAFSGPYSGPPIKERAKAVVPFLLAAAAYTQWAHLPLEQILNGAIAAVLFNIIYDTLLSRKLRWFALCPVIDSMNHQSASKNEVAYEYFGDRFSVTAERKYAQGEQVFITYGLQSNDKLLQYYGFVEPKNPADVYVVPDLLEALRDLPYLKIPEEGVQAAKQAGLSVALQKVALTRQGLPDKALQTVRMVLASAHLLEQHSAADFRQQVDALHEESCLQALKDVCLSLSSQLTRIPAKQSDGTISRRRQDLAKQFRQQKSRVLQSCCKSLENQIRKARKQQPA